MSGLASGLVFAVLAGCTARTLASADTQLFPGGEGLWGHHLVLARYYAHLSNRQRAWALAGSVSIAGTAATLRWIRTGARLDALSALEGGGAAIVPFVAATGMGERLLAQVAAADRAMSEASRAAIDRASAIGVNAEARRFLEWIDAAYVALAAIPDIPEPEAARLRPQAAGVDVNGRSMPLRRIASHRIHQIAPVVPDRRQWCDGVRPSRR